MNVEAFRKLIKEIPKDQRHRVQVRVNGSSNFQASARKGLVDLGGGALYGAYVYFDIDTKYKANWETINKIKSEKQKIERQCERLKERLKVKPSDKSSIYHYESYGYDSGKLSGYETVIEILDEILHDIEGEA